MHAINVVHGDVFLISDKCAYVIQRNQLNAAQGFGADVVALRLIVGAGCHALQSVWALRAFEHVLKLFRSHGLKQIAHRFCTEGIQGVLIERGAEDYRGRVVQSADLAGCFDAVFAGHTYVQQNHVRVKGGDSLKGSLGAVCLGDHLMLQLSTMRARRWRAKGSSSTITMSMVHSTG